jgi:diamine N-acetyltransferase
MADDAAVTLREITRETLRGILMLVVAPEQERFVASNAVSLAQAHFTPEAWYRGIYAGEEPVGFVMLYDATRAAEPPERPTAYLWRFMIDHRQQGKGYGAEALRLVIEHVRGRGCFSALELSYVPGEGSPEPFYKRFGFRDTGRVDDDEIVLELPLTTS